jgi:hypothetical protein
MMRGMHFVTQKKKEKNDKKTISAADRPVMLLPRLLPVVHFPSFLVLVAISNGPP